MTNNDIIKIAHRGAPAYEPENTLASFSKALELGADMIELDVHLSKDKHLIVMHDEIIDRTTDGKGKIKDLSLKQIKQLKIIDKENDVYTEKIKKVPSIFGIGKGEKVPILNEVFDLVGKKVKINIELKANGTAKAVARLINKYVHKDAKKDNKAWKYADFHISSFNFDELRFFRENIPEIDIGVLVDDSNFNGFEELLLFAKEIDAYSLNIPFNHTTKEIVDHVHKHNLKVLVWTPNTKKEIQKMISIGVDGIITDHVELISTIYDCNNRRL
ncbi:MAG: glycerophosphodiester phosphodiesterase family protein [Candidatus Woesearchaeota archaeon]